MNQDEEYLRLLSIFHYVVGGMVALFSLLPIFYMIFGLVIIAVAADSGSGPPAFIGWLFVMMAGGVMLLGVGFAACIAAAGRCLVQRKAYTFCLVMAAVQCIFVPIGTVLGVFTIIVLIREPVKQMFEDQ